MIDCYSVKPIDAPSLRTALEDTGLIVVVEDHRVEGGIGDAVLDALAATGPLSGRVVKLAVTGMPGSGTPEELRAWAGIDAGDDRRARTVGARPGARPPAAQLAVRRSAPRRGPTRSISSGGTGRAK